MCELLGISVHPPATMDVYFKAFRSRAVENQSGWGVGWYEGQVAHVIKEPARADHSETATALIDTPPSSDLFLIHVRYATVGRVSVANTHPFLARLGDQEWIFEHNGTVEDIDGLSTGIFRVEGDTDSEVAFYYLLTRLGHLPEGAGDTEAASEVHEVARELSRRGQSNFLLSDGRTLYAYYDGHRTLHYVERHASYGKVRIADDEDYTVDLEIPFDPDERAVIVASLPLTKERWTSLRPGELLICRDGAVVDVLPPEGPPLDGPRPGSAEAAGRTSAGARD
ncbi:MAG: class II glutamine amidotransferase [Actinomycetota bacterium]